MIRATTGEISLTKCPMANVPDVVWQTVELIDLFAEGLPPVAGGTLDQADSFLTVARVFRGEVARHMASKVNT